nr:DNA repair protein RecO [Desulfobacterales bacterium]
MANLSTPAIVLRVLTHGEYDKIITLFTSTQGLVSVIAKGAKKSKRRFSGVLELFSVLEVVWSHGTKKGLPVLQEASVVHCFETIRKNIVKMAYASCWTEMVYAWMEKGESHLSIFELLRSSLELLDKNVVSDELLSIHFQTNFMAEIGFQPRLDKCLACNIPLEKFPTQFAEFSLPRGGLLCQRCWGTRPNSLTLSIGTVKHLQWILKNSRDKALRLRLSDSAINESFRFLDGFVSYYLGRNLKTLKFIRQVCR